MELETQTVEAGMLNIGRFVPTRTILFQPIEVMPHYMLGFGGCALCALVLELTHGQQGMTRVGCVFSFAVPKDGMAPVRPALYDDR